MRRIVLALVLILAVLSASGAQGGLLPEQFLQRARNSGGGGSVSALSGTLQHLRDGRKMEAVPVYLGLVIRPEGVRGQLILDGKEGYWFTRHRTLTGFAADVTPMEPAAKAPLLARYGLDPADLGMGFLWKNFRAELEPSRVKGLACRVLVLQDAAGGDAVRVYILRDYYFPLRVEFFADEAAARDGKTPLRTLEVGSFRQKNGLYYAEVIDLRGNSWRSRVTFDGNTAELQAFRKNIPLPFRELAR